MRKLTRSQINYSTFHCLAQQFQNDSVLRKFRWFLLAGCFTLAPNSGPSISQKYAIYSSRVKKWKSVDHFKKSKQWITEDGIWKEKNRTITSKKFIERDKNHNEIGSVFWNSKESLFHSHLPHYACPHAHTQISFHPPTQQLAQMHPPGSNNPKFLRKIKQLYCRKKVRIPRKNPHEYEIKGLPTSLLRKCTNKILGF